jgi:hypothetical protein
MKKILRIVFMVIPTLLSAGNSDYQKYFDEFSDYILTPVNLMEVKHEFVVEKMEFIHGINSKIELQEVGKSVEGRSINMFSFGKGDIKLLLWSQMHGDEATATAGLLSVFYYLAKNFQEPFVQSLYNNLSIHAIIMLNPDGSEKYDRRNSQGIDINRDAQHLASPEGQILKKMHEQIKPDFGFNLHDMRGKETVGETGEILTKALMAPPYNKANEDSPTRIKAKKLAVIIKNGLDQVIKGHVARYKADYMPRAFGDAFQNWGVSTVLIESGIPDSPEPHHLTRLSFLSLFVAFEAIAEGYVEDIDPADYEKIPLEGIQLFDLIIENATIFNGRNHAPFKGDIGINVSRKWKDNETVLTGTIEDIGDLSITSGRKIIKGENLVVTPGFILPADQPLEKVIEQGITTPVGANKSVSGQLSEFPDSGKISPTQIHTFTAQPAQILNLNNKGVIDIDMIADILIFESNDQNRLHLDDLSYVIKNGQIVFEKDRAN